jgi:catechol 2,3-dioxygenase-like lactoylglutathione lyase family enzyme
MPSIEPAVAVRGVHHAGVVVRRLDESITFYERMFGAAVALRVDEEAYSLAMLDLGNACVELLEFRPETRGEPARGDAIGDGHVALRVDDVTGAHARLAARGVRFERPPLTVESGPSAGYVLAFCLDPDGNRIELIQLP